MFILRRKIIVISFFMLPLITGQLQPCEDTASIELKNKSVTTDNIEYDGISFPQKFVYSKNVSGEIKTFGCVCELRNCFRKCCEFGSVVYNRTCAFIPQLNSIIHDGVTVNYLQTSKRNVSLQSSHFYTLFGRPCKYMYEEVSWFLQEDGKLYVETPHNIPPSMMVTPENYCIDNFVTDDDGYYVSKVEALVCFGTEEEEDPRNYVLSAICMLVSCVFILLTVAVYIWLPKLHNVHGRVLIAYLTSLFVGFLIMAIMQLLIHYENQSKGACETMTFVIYFSLLSAFFWLNVMCYDIWRVFSGKREIRPQKLLVWVQLRSYAIYAFGIPAILTILLIILEYSGLPQHPWLPLIRLRGCFLSGHTKILYLYGPILILCIANMVLFVLTAVKIARTKKETSVLSSRESSRHDQQNDKQTLFLYVKLFILMGISWILEVLSAVYPSKHWRVSDVYNVLIGLIIFIIFVCKRQIYNLIKERYGNMKRHPTSQSMTSWSRATTTKDESTINSKNGQ